MTLKLSAKTVRNDKDMNSESLYNMHEITIFTKAYLWLLRNFKDFENLMKIVFCFF